MLFLFIVTILDNCLLYFMSFKLAPVNRDEVSNIIFQRNFQGN